MMPRQLAKFGRRRVPRASARTNVQLPADECNAGPARGSREGACDMPADAAECPGNQKSVRGKRIVLLVRLTRCDENGLERPPPHRTVADRQRCAALAPQFANELADETIRYRHALDFRGKVD